MERRRGKRKKRSEPIRPDVRHSRLCSTGDEFVGIPVRGFPNYVIHKDGSLLNVLTGKKKKYSCKNGYFFCWLHHHGVKKMFYCHRLLAEHFIPNPNQHKYVDHIDGVTTNNELKNLRWCSQSANLRNQKKKRRNGLRGCYYHRQNNRWCSRIKVDKKTINLGCYATEREANLAYEKARERYFNE